jgi:hypothetical protein
MRQHMPKRLANWNCLLVQAIGRFALRKGDAVARGSKKWVDKTPGFSRFPLGAAENMRLRSLAAGDVCANSHGADLRPHRAGERRYSRSVRSA